MNRNTNTFSGIDNEWGKEYNNEGNRMEEGTKEKRKEIEFFESNSGFSSFFLVFRIKLKSTIRSFR